MSAAVDVAVAVRGLGVTIGRRAILRTIDVEVSRSSFVALVGPNGAGKTTLLRALAGLVPSHGAITFGTSDLAELSPQQRARHVAYVPQHPLIPDGMTVAAYVLLGRTPHLGRFAVESKADRAFVADALQLLGLTDMATRPVGELSGGERQRAVLARAVTQQSPVLLLDEPTTGLDLGHQHQVLEVVDRLRRELGVTVIAAVHDLTLASQYAGRIAVLAEGALIGDGCAADVITADTLARHWGVDAQVVGRSDGSVHVLSERPSFVGHREVAHA